MSVPVEDHTKHTPSGELGGFGIVPRFLRGRLAANELAIYVALSWRVDEDGRVFIRQKRLAEEAGMSPSTCQRALNSLWEKDIVRWAPRYAADGKTIVCNTYTLRILKSAAFEAMERPTFPERGSGRRGEEPQVGDSDEGGHSNGMRGVIQNESGGHSNGMTERDPMNETPGNDQKSRVDSSSSSPRSTREAATHDDGATAGETITPAQADTIANAVVAVRPEWHTPGVHAQLRQVLHLPYDDVREGFLAAASDRRIDKPFLLAEAAQQHLTARVDRQAAGERRERQAEEWRQQVHDDAENRSKPETRAQMIQRLKDEKAHALAAKRQAAQEKPTGAYRGAGAGEPV